MIADMYSHLKNWIIRKGQFCAFINDLPIEEAEIRIFLKGLEDSGLISDETRQELLGYFWHGYAKECKTRSLPVPDQYSDFIDFNGL